MTHLTGKELQEMAANIEELKDSPYYDVLKDGLETIIDYSIRHGLLDKDFQLEIG